VPAATRGGEPTTVELIPEHSPTNMDEWADRLHRSGIHVVYDHPEMFDSEDNLLNVFEADPTGEGKWRLSTTSIERADAAGCALETEHPLQPLAAPCSPLQPPAAPCSPLQPLQPPAAPHHHASPPLTTIPHHHPSPLRLTTTPHHRPSPPLTTAPHYFPRNPLEDAASRRSAAIVPPCWLPPRAALSAR
jgi:hypothetical protein